MSVRSTDRVPSERKIAAKAGILALACSRTALRRRSRCSTFELGITAWPESSTLKPALNNSSVISPYRSSSSLVKSTG